MRRYRFLLVLITTAFFFTSPSFGTVIRLNQPKKDAMLGVRVHPTGPVNAPLAPALFGFAGGGLGMSADSKASRFYSGNATFDRPVASVTMTVENSAVSDSRNQFTIVAFNNNHRVSRKRVNLGGVGHDQRVTLTAPSIDKVKWFGAGWALHAYVITELNVTFAPPAKAPDPGPQVSASAPEPGVAVVAGPMLIAFLLRRQRTHR